MKKVKKNPLESTKSAHPSAKKRQKEEFRLGKFIVSPLAVAEKESFGSSELTSKRRIGFRG